MSTNFTNGSLVMRVWNFDGSGEMIAKFQYFSDAKKFAEMQAAATPDDCNYFYLAVCDSECDFKAYFSAGVSARMKAAEKAVRA